MMTIRPLIVALLATVALGLQGCAAIGLSLVGSGAGIGAGTGTSYFLDSVVYRTFSNPADEVRRATLIALRRMDLPVKADDVTPEGRRIVAEATDRSIEIELEKLTPRTTRMRVVAKQGVLFRDRATAGEIIAQTERSVDELPALTQKMR